MLADKSERILLSAYACFGNHGSEPGVGYNWLKELLAQGYKVTLATSMWSYSRLDEDVKKNPNLLEILVVGSERGDRIARKNRLIYQIYLIACQIMLRWKVGRSRVRYAYVHHLTFGGVTIPSLIAKYGERSIYGPVGGAEYAPLYLAKYCGYKALLKEVLKKISVVLTKLDPFLVYTKLSYDIILLKNKSNLGYYSLVNGKCIVKPEICSDQSISFEERGRAAGIHVAFSARGIYWKGGMIAAAMAKRILDENPSEEFVFHFFGDGPEFDEMKNILGGYKSSFFHGRVPRDEYLELIKDVDVLWFPSFHDSSGNVVLEALVAGRPVLAFDLGGPSSIIDHEDMIIKVGRALSKDDLYKEFYERTVLLKNISLEERREISKHYTEKFSREKMLSGVYK